MLYLAFIASSFRVTEEICYSKLYILANPLNGRHFYSFISSLIGELIVHRVVRGPSVRQLYVRRPLSTFLNDLKR